MSEDLTSSAEGYTDAIKKIANYTLLTISVVPRCRFTATATVVPIIYNRS